VEKKAMAPNSEWIALLGIVVAVTCSSACDDEKPSIKGQAGAAGTSAGASQGATSSVAGDAAGGSSAVAGETSSGGSKGGSTQQGGGTQQGGESSGGAGHGGRPTGEAGASSTLGKPCEEFGACSAGEICFDTSTSCNGATCQRKKAGCSQNTCGCLPTTTCAPPGMCFAVTNCVYCLTPPTP
jgi:hypothetical protein